MKQNWIIALIFLIICALSFNIEGSSKLWRFAVVGDTHVGSTDTIAEMIPFILADSIDCILIHDNKIDEQ